ncbi:MAG: four helix bundle protein [Terriglobales bacterium]
MRCGVSCEQFAEGKGRRTDKEFLLFLHHARRSVFEVETQLTIARRLGYVPETEVLRLSEFRRRNR